MLRNIFVLILSGAMISCASMNLAWFHSGKNHLSVQAPPNWIHDKTSKYLSVYNPNGRETVNASAYKKKGDSFSKFAKSSFDSVQAYYTPVREYHLKNAVVREYQGNYPGETRPEYYIVAVIKRKNIYIQMTILTDRKYLKLHKKLYLHMIETVTENAKG